MAPIIPDYNDHHANNLFHPAPVQDRSLNTGNFQFDFGFRLSADALPHFTTVADLSQVLASESIFCQHLQTSMPLYSNPLAQANSRPSGPGYGHPAATRQPVDQGQPRQHTQHKRRLVSRPSAVSNDRSDVFQMGVGLARQTHAFPAPPRGAAEQNRIQQEQVAPPTGLSTLNAHQTSSPMFRSNNADPGQSLYSNPFPFEKTNTETTWQPQVHTGFSPTFPEFDELLPPGLIYQQSFQPLGGLFNDPDLPVQSFLPDMPRFQQMSLGVPPMNSGTGSNTSTFGSFSSASAFDLFDTDNTSIMLDNDRTTHCMWSGSSPFSNLDSTEDAPVTTGPLHPPVSGPGAGWKAPAPGSNVHVPTVSPKLAFPSPSFSTLAATSAESLLTVASTQQCSNSPHLGLEGDKATPTPNLSGKKPKAPANSPRGRKALPDRPRSRHSSSSGKPKPGRRPPPVNPSPTPSPSPVRRRAKRRHIPAAEEDDLFSPLNRDSDSGSSSSSRARPKSKPKHELISKPKTKPKLLLPEPSPRKSHRLHGLAAANPPTTPATTINPASAPKPRRYTRPPKNYEAAALAPPRAARPAPDSKRQTNEHPVPPRFASRAEAEKFLIESKKNGLTYRAIRKLGGFTEAESTLRGKYRVLTKEHSERVRKPEWKERDLRLLERAVRTLAQLPPQRYPDQKSVSAAMNGQVRYGIDLSEAKIPWKRIAEWMMEHGASYKFGNATVCKRWEELVAEKKAEGKDPGGPFFDDEEDVKEEV